MQSCSVQRVRVRILQQNSLARHWARDWRALALTKDLSLFLTFMACRPPIPLERFFLSFLMCPAVKWQLCVVLHVHPASLV